MSESDSDVYPHIERIKLFIMVVAHNIGIQMNPKEPTKTLKYYYDLQLKKTSLISMVCGVVRSE